MNCHQSSPVSGSNCYMGTATHHDRVKLVVEPSSCLHDEPVDLSVNGLQPGQEITLEASLIDTRAVLFHAYAYYKANNNGQVDVNTMESLGGSYKGVFPMGLIGSLAPAFKKNKFTRFFKRDVENPSIVKLFAFSGHLTHEELVAENRTEPLSTTTHLRHYMAPGVQRIPVRYGKVRGCLFLPPGDGPFPGVVDMFGSAGGLLEYRSAQLASRGIASLALAFFGYDDLPKSLEEFNISYFEEAVEFLLKHDKVISKGVGVIGTSKGGDLALAMAAFIPSVIACVTINCFNVPVGAGLRVGERLYPGMKVFDIHNPHQYHLQDDGALQMKTCSLGNQDFKNSILPIERSNAAFLFLVGSDDRDVNSEYYAQECCCRLTEHGYGNSYQVLSFPGTGHLLEPPYSPHCYASFQHSALISLVWGGNARFHTQGQVEAWPRMIQFLKKNIAEARWEDLQNHAANYLKSNL